MLDLRRISDAADYFIIASGTSGRQVKAIADAITEKMEASGVRVLHREGYPHSSWILIDCGSAVAHIFTGEFRTFYSLERLWGDAPLVSRKTVAKRKRASKVRAETHGPD